MQIKCFYAYCIILERESDVLGYLKSFATDLEEEQEKQICGKNTSHFGHKNRKEQKLNNVSQQYKEPCCYINYSDRVDNRFGHVYRTKVDSIRIKISFVFFCPIKFFNRLYNVDQVRDMKKKKNIVKQSYRNCWDAISPGRDEKP